VASIGIMVSGKAVPTAPSTRPSAPCTRFGRPPRISAALVNGAAATRIATRAKPDFLYLGYHLEIPKPHAGRAGIRRPSASYSTFSSALFVPTNAASQGLRS
jgi:hypothetical protein